MTFQILCLSGGGFLGLYTASVIAGIEESIGEPIARHFDLIAGTSVGGIIALGLAAEVPAIEIKKAFIKDGPEIFSSRPPPSGFFAQTATLLQYVKRSKYPSAKLGGLICNIIGNEKTIGDLQHRVLIPSVNISKGMPQVFKTAHHKTFVRDWRLSVVDVALATSAAPTFFPLHRIGGELFADGGLYANSPDHLALHEAEHFLEVPVAQISMLSIGTTSSSFSFSNSLGVDLGWMDWMERQRLSTVMIATQQINAEYMMRHRLGERYLRIDRAQSCDQERSLALDVASEGAILDLQALGEASLREHLGRLTLPAMLEHVASKAVFFHK